MREEEKERVMIGLIITFFEKGLKEGKFEEKNWKQEHPNNCAPETKRKEKGGKERERTEEEEREREGVNKSILNEKITQIFKMRTIF